MMKRVFLLLVFLAGFHGVTMIYAQRPPAVNPPLKWGKVSPEQLAMDHYAPDSNATAVILADYGDVFFAADGTVMFERHTRIKILSEAGYDWGTVSVPYLGKRRYGQRVRAVKGQTFTQGPDGKAVRHKMGKKAIYEEDLDGDWKRVLFTLPALEPGAVIEYVYRVESDSPIFLPDWQFQGSEPTLWSEYRAELPREYGYVRSIVGISKFDVEASEEYAGGRGSMHRWVMKDLPALREEPFMTTPEDYRASIEFQLQQYWHPSEGVVDFMNTWEGVARELMDMPSFGEQLRPSRKLRAQVEQLTAGLDAPVDKMKALYDFVRTSVVWNGRYRYVAEQDVDEVLKTQSATSAEMALLLAAMLRAAALEAHPVLISTRSHGRVIKEYPILSQFNTVLVAVPLGGETHLLDATDPLRPYDLLPYEALNGRGWLVDEQKHAWIPIKANGRYYHRSYFDATLDASGTLTATLQATDEGYSALNKRHERKEANAEENFVKEVMLNGLNESMIEVATVTDEAITEPLVTETTVSIPGYAQVAGDFIYLNPTPLGRLEENPLRLPERTFPVDLAYPRTIIRTLRMTLPEGYAVQELPGNAQVSLPNDGGHFQRVVGVEDRILTMQTRFVLRKAVYAPRQYQPLRKLYDRVVASGADQMVLKRTNEPEGAGEQNQ